MSTWRNHSLPRWHKQTTQLSTTGQSQQSTLYWIFIHSNSTNHVTARRSRETGLLFIGTDITGSHLRKTLSTPLSTDTVGEVLMVWTDRETVWLCNQIRDVYSLVHGSFNTGNSFCSEKSNCTGAYRQTDRHTQMHVSTNYRMTE